MVEDKNEELYDLWTLLLRATRLAAKAREKELRPHGISRAEAGVLRVIFQKQGRLTPSDIARQTRREIHTVNALLHRMQGREMLQIVRGENGKDIVEMHLTDKGYQAYENSLRLDSVSEILSILSKDERTSLASIMCKVGNSALEVIKKCDHPRFS